MKHGSEPRVGKLPCDYTASLEFQHSPVHAAGKGGPEDPSEISFPGCSCQSSSCLATTCSCLHYGENYNNACINVEGSELAYSKAIFECTTMCRCGEFCQNRVIQRALHFRLEVFKTAEKGWGLRILEFIPKGRFVCEYAGEVLDFKEACRRTRLQRSSDSNYIIAVREHLCDERIMETFVDPTYISNVGRFLNHSCEPNLVMLPVRKDSVVPKLALFADRIFVQKKNFHMIILEDITIICQRSKKIRRSSSKGTNF